MENDLQEKKKNLHNLVDSTSRNLVKSLENIINALEFSNNQNDRDSNIQINSGMEALSNDLNTLHNIINKMRVKELKYDKEKLATENKIYSKKKLIKATMDKLIDIHESISQDVLEMQRSIFCNIYNYIKCEDKHQNQ